MSTKKLRGIVPQNSLNGQNGYPYESTNPTIRKGRVTLASKISMKPTFWAWASDGYGRIPVGELTLVAGHGEAGKSILNIDLIARVTQGELEGHYFGHPCFCLIAASEDDWEKTILPRLVVAGADLYMIGRFDVVTTLAKDGIKVSLPSDYGELESAIQENDAVWVFFESVVSAIDIAKDVNHGQHVRQVLEPLAEIARRQECVIIGSVHFNKNTASHAMERMSGSMEFRNVARAVIYLALQEDGTGVISKSKNNLGRSWPSLAYEIYEEVASRNPYITAGRIEITGETNADASEIIAAGRKNRKQSPEVIAIIKVLNQMFSHHDDWKAEDAWEELEKAGVNYNDRTVAKARDELGIRTQGIYQKGRRGALYTIWTTKPITVKDYVPDAKK
jgi:hypothetical protein